MGTELPTHSLSRRDFLRDTLLGAASLAALRLPAHSALNTAPADPASVSAAVLTASTCRGLRFEAESARRSPTFNRALTDIIASVEELTSIDAVREGSGSGASLSKRQKLEAKIQDIAKRCPELSGALSSDSQRDWQEFVLNSLPQALAPHGILVMAQARPILLSRLGDEVKQLGITPQFFKTEKLSDATRTVAGVDFARGVFAVRAEYVAVNGALQSHPLGEMIQRGGAFTAYGNIFITSQGLESARNQYVQEKEVLQGWLQRIDSKPNGLSQELETAEKKNMRQFILRQYAYAQLVKHCSATLEDPQAFQSHRVEQHEDYHAADTFSGRARGFIVRAKDSTLSALQGATTRSCFHHELSSQLGEICDPSGLGLAIVIRNSFAPVDPRTKNGRADPHDDSADWIVRRAVQRLVEDPQYGFVLKAESGLERDDQAFLFLASLPTTNRPKLMKLSESLRQEHEKDRMKYGNVP